MPSCIQALSWPHADPSQQHRPDDQEDGQEQWKQPPQTLISSCPQESPLLGGTQLWSQSPLEEGCGLAPQVGCAVCSESLLPSLSLAPRGLMVVGGVAVVWLCHGLGAAQPCHLMHLRGQWARAPRRPPQLLGGEGAAQPLCSGDVPQSSPCNWAVLSFPTWW